MPRVELSLSSYADATFSIKKIVEFDSEDWYDMDVEQRNELVTEEGEKFLRDNVEWDYKVL